MVVVRSPGKKQSAATRAKRVRTTGHYGIGNAALLAGLAMASPASAEVCQFMGAPTLGGVEPTLAVNADCTDPDYNEETFVIESTTQKVLEVSPSLKIPYTEVLGHFPAIRTKAELPSGVTGGPTVVKHSVRWNFPDKAHFGNRFFQGVYPLGGGYVDPTFAFTHGGYTVSIAPGNPSVGYRVDAAAAKLAKAYASKLYGNSNRIYGYIFGVSGGSVQTMGAVQGTTGVWDGAMPISIATHSLNVHSFPWSGLYALGVPQDKRDAIAAAVAPGSGVDIYAGLNSEQRAVLDELLNAGFSRKALENNKFNLAMATILASDIPKVDPSYEDDFWSQPGYEGTNPPAYLSAAKVDAFAVITEIKRNAQGAPESIAFDPATVPQLGSIGALGLQYYVYAADGKTRTVGTGRGMGSVKLSLDNLPTGGNPSGTLSGTLSGNRLTLTGANDADLLDALRVGGKVRFNNRFLLSVLYYPRHTIPNNGNPAYNQYKNADGSPKYPQRRVSAAEVATRGTSGGIVEDGHIKFKTFVIENTVDPSSYPYVASFYYSQIRAALGASQTDQMARIYYNDNADHATFGVPRGKDITMIAGFGGIVQQGLLDLAAWVEKGIAPLPSTNFAIDGMNQVVLPAKASERRGLQPVVTLNANGGERAEVKVGQPVNLKGRIDVPGKGKVVQYDWYLGEGPLAYEPATVLPKPKAAVEVARTVTFAKPGTYLVTLRSAAQRDGLQDKGTMLENLARVRVVVQ